MKIGKRVKVSNPNQINYPLEGKVIEEEISESWGLTMSKVKFSTVAVWYADADLEDIS